MKKTRVRNLIMIGPLYPHLLRENGGVFPFSINDPYEVVNCFCAWYFCMLAHKTLIDVPAQVTLEGDTDQTVKLRDILRGCMKAYGLDADSGDAIESVMQKMPYCREIAFKKGITWRIDFQRWLATGGKAYDEVTRDPDKI